MKLRLESEELEKILEPDVFEKKTYPKKDPVILPFNAPKLVWASKKAAKS